LLLAFSLAACAAYGTGGLQAGMDEAAVVSSMGMPPARYTLPDGGTRLAYARGPYGKHTWMVDLGADGKVREWHQALSEAQFALLKMGIGEEELLRTIGPPSHVSGRGIRPGVVWSYRYPTYECRWFQATLDENRRLVEAGYGVDPACEVIDAKWRL
jgi:hypothetical protein